MLKFTQMGKSLKYPIKTNFTFLFIEIREDFKHNRKVGRLVNFSGASRTNREGWHLCCNNSTRWVLFLEILSAAE